jgi:hypothetical protein
MSVLFVCLRGLVVLFSCCVALLLLYIIDIFGRMAIPITPVSTDASSLKETEPKPTKSEKYYDDEGDLEILSSDNVLFKLHAYHFQASSYVTLSELDVGVDLIIQPCFQRHAQSWNRRQEEYC